MNSNNNEIPNQIIDDDVEIIIDDLIDNTISNDVEDSKQSGIQTEEIPFENQIKNLMSDPENTDFVFNMMKIPMEKLGATVPSNFNDPEFKNNFFQNIFNTFAGSNFDKILDDFESLDASQQTVNTMLSSMLSNDTIKNNIDNVGKTYGLNGDVNNILNTLTQKISSTELGNSNFINVVVQLASETELLQKGTPDDVD